MTEYNPYAEITRYSIGDTKTLKIGIIGDTQLIPLSVDHPFQYFSTSLKKSLEILKNNNINILIIDGDITDYAKPESYDNFLFQFNEVYGKENKENIPILNLIMGNHDYWLSYNLENNKLNIENGKIEEMQKLFEEKTKEKPFSHKIINGFHFINWSCEDGSLDNPNKNHIWFEKEIKIAIEENNKIPIFVTTHFPPKNTVYGSEEWGEINLNKIFEKYPQIINFSGHSHYSLIDERSIYQNNYTCIQTQSLSYIELEKGKVNGSILKNEFDDLLISAKNFMGLICEVNEKEVLIKRISFEKNLFYGENWIIDIPIDKNTFRYLYDVRKNKSNKPKFIFEKDEDRKVFVEKINDKNIIKFKQATHENFVHSYKIIFKDNNNKEEEYLYFSDFFLMPSDRKDIISLGLVENLKGKYNIRIYAIESYGKESENFIEDTINIS